MPTPTSTKNLNHRFQDEGLPTIKPNIRKIKKEVQPPQIIPSKIEQSDSTVMEYKIQRISMESRN